MTVILSMAVFKRNCLALERQLSRSLLAVASSRGHYQAKCSAALRLVPRRGLVQHPSSFSWWQGWRLWMHQRNSQCCAVGFSGGGGGGGGGEDVQLSANNSSMLSSLTVFVMYARTEQAAIWKLLQMPSNISSLASSSLMLKKMENKVFPGWALLNALGDGEAAWQWTIILHLTLLTFTELEKDGEYWGGGGGGQQRYTWSLTVHCSWQYQRLNHIYWSCEQNVLFSAFLL